MQDKMENVYIKDEFIKLGQAMKLCGAAGSGSEAKAFIEKGDVKVNGETCTERGRKLKPGDQFSYFEHDYQINRTS